jgi:dihydroorotate dehydrogenase (NAD+) catalytic subunit
MRKPNLSIKIGKLDLKNPVMVASGTFGYAEEFQDFLDLRKLGAVVTKTVTLKPRQGNPVPRTCETPAGMLNSIGLENPGVAVFLRDKLPFLKRLKVPIIMSIASESSPQEFVELANRLDKIACISALELNISCPNIRSHNARLIAQDPKATYEVVKYVRRSTKKTLITKLSPNVTDIVEVALTAEEAGSDGIALINTLTAMSIDIQTRRPKIAAVTAGLSGPAIRPVAIRMVWEVYQKVKIPIIGMGGIMDAASAIEFFIAGASAVSIGTANFVNPRITVEVIRGIKKYLQDNKIASIHKLIGSLKCQA